MTFLMKIKIILILNNLNKVYMKLWEINGNIMQTKPFFKIKNSYLSKKYLILLFKPG